jgi:hypothetical protein
MKSIKAMIDEQPESTYELLSDILFGGNYLNGRTNTQISKTKYLSRYVGIDLSKSKP